MSDEPDLYAALGVAPNSDDVVIRAAFRALMLKYHPDTNRSPDATDQAAKINAAFAVLGDRSRRAAYDLSRFAQEELARRRPPAGPPPSPPQPASPPAAARPVAPAPARRRIGRGPVFGGIALLALGAVVYASGQHLSAPPGGGAYGPAARPEMMDDLAAADQGLDPSPETPPSAMALPQPPEPVRSETVEAAASDFMRAYSMGGMPLARSYSRICHQALIDNVGWASVDDCAAFDYVAAYVGEHRAGDGASTAYFAALRTRQVDSYTTLGAPGYAVSGRLGEIRSGAEKAAAEMLSTRFAQQGPPPVASPPPVTAPADAGEPPEPSNLPTPADQNWTVGP